MKVKNVKLMNAVLAIHSGPPPSFFVVHYALQGLSFIFYSWFARRITARRSCGWKLPTFIQSEFFRCWILKFSDWKSCWKNSSATNPTIHVFRLKEKILLLENSDSTINPTNIVFSVWTNFSVWKQGLRNKWLIIKSS